MRDGFVSLQLRTRPPASLVMTAAVNRSLGGGALGAAFALEAFRRAGGAPHDASESTCVDVEVPSRPERRD